MSMVMNDLAVGHCMLFIIGGLPFACFERAAVLCQWLADNVKTMNHAPQFPFPFAKP